MPSLCVINLCHHAVTMNYEHYDLDTITLYHVSNLSIPTAHAIALPHDSMILLVSPFYRKMA